MQPLVGIFYSVTSAGLHLWFERGECLHQQQQRQHLYILLSSICAPAPDWKSLIRARQHARGEPHIPAGVGDDSPPSHVRLGPPRTFPAPQPTFSWLRLVRVRWSDPWIYSGCEERPGRLLIARGEGETLGSTGSTSERRREKRSCSSQFDHNKRRRTMFAWEGARRFRVLSALVVGSIVCCAKRLVIFCPILRSRLSRLLLGLICPAAKGDVPSHVFRVPAVVSASTNRATCLS